MKILKEDVPDLVMSVAAIVLLVLWVRFHFFALPLHEWL
jgi:hypothetical protein